MFKQHVKNPTKTSWEEFKKQRNKVTSLKRKGMKLFCMETSMYSKHHGEFWKKMRPLLPSRGKNQSKIVLTRQQLAKVNIDSINVGMAEVSSSSEVKNLGCWLDNQLKLDSHINRLCKSAFFHLYNIRRIRKFLSPETTQILVNAFVTSRLDYCNSILYGLPATELYKLQRVQNSAARLICNVGRFDHISPSLKTLHWLPIKFRIQFKVPMKRNLFLTNFKVYP